jgi:hypothetical protein
LYELAGESLFFTSGLDGWKNNPERIVSPIRGALSPRLSIVEKPVKLFKSAAFPKPHP